MSALPAAGVPVMTAPPCGLATPVPVKPIGDTGAGVFEITITEPSLKPSIVGWKFTVNWHDDPGATVCPVHRSPVTGNVPGVPDTRNACWICSGKSPWLEIVTGCATLLPIATAPKSVCVGVTTSSGPFRAVACSGTRSGLLALSLVTSSSAWKVPGPDGLKPMPMPQLLLLPNTCCSQFWPKAIENSAASGPTIDAEEVCVEKSLEFWRLTFWVWPPKKYGWVLKIRGFGLAVNVPVIPVPVSGTSSTPSSLSRSSSVAALAPGLEGRNAIETTQELPCDRNTFVHPSEVTWN